MQGICISRPAEGGMIMGRRMDLFICWSFAGHLLGKTWIQGARVYLPQLRADNMEKHKSGNTAKGKNVCAFCSLGAKKEG